MKHRILEYEHPKGACPVSDFINNLEPKIRKKTYSQLKRLQEMDCVLQPPLVKVFRVCRCKGLYELRVCTSQMVRIMFYIHTDGSIVLLHGFVKKQEKATDKALEVARARRLALASGEANYRLISR